MTVRVQVDAFDAGTPRCTVVYLPSVDDLNPDVVLQLQPHVDRIIEALAQQVDLHPEDAAVLLVAELAEQLADAEAYEREAARRGVLAL